MLSRTVKFVFVYGKIRVFAIDKCNTIYSGFVRRNGVVCTVSVSSLESVLAVLFYLS